ncbi:hypothetical protein QFC21_004737 [Naganishia friedmannii]|uniref:Uncharacterized protein n=1 Tax=Naganishia friedmannii TaxID=89922 RepID=A0ACC2VF22_9TREE|nr:hypothetical protein QFC21_004737 [Naganishia friedmannii]
MMSPPPFPLGSQYRRDGDRHDEISSAPSNPFIYEDDDSQQDQDAFSQTQRDVPKSQMSGSEEEVSGTQLDPRRKYWAVFTPCSPSLPTLKLYWPTPGYPSDPQDIQGMAPLGSNGEVRIGRGPYPRMNDIVLVQKRISNRHCRIYRMDQKPGDWRGGGAEPVVYIEDLNSSNGTWVNGKRITKQILQHGDEISLGSPVKTDDHDARYIFRSVGREGERLDSAGAVFEAYQFRETLGTGTFAEVKKAIEVETGVVRAIKCITKHKFANNPKTMQLFQREVSILESLDHENICRLIEVWDDPQQLYLVLEFIDGGDLLDYIMKRANNPGPGLSENETIDLTKQICSGMAYTHARGVAHRDLKPENILLTSDVPPVVKIADYGLAKMVEEGTALRTMVGTPQYLAPEIVMQTRAQPGYENVVDSWSVGVIVYSMMTNTMPFDENPEESLQVRLVSEIADGLQTDETSMLIRQMRVQRRFTEDFDRGLLEELGISSTAIDFIDKLLAKDPATRMTLTEALQHPWLNEGLVPDSQPLPASFNFDRRASRSATNTAGPSTSATEDASEDFSYPMTKLHIETPGLDRTLPTVGSDSFCSETNDRLASHSSSFWGNQPRLSEIQLGSNEESLSSAVSDSNPNSQEPSRLALFGAGQPRAQLQLPRALVLQQSPPSPPLTDSAMDDIASLPGFIEETPGSLPDFIEETPCNVLDSNNGNFKQTDVTPETDLPTPQLQAINREITVFMTPLTASSTGLILKRKRSDASMISNESSDLSPVPESQTNRFADSRAANATLRISSAETTPKGTKRRATTAIPSPVPTRSSARIRATQNSSSGPNSPRTPTANPRAKQI